MVEYSFAISLVGYVIGALGGLLIFIELFQVPNYLKYKPKLNRYDIELKPEEVQEYTIVGRIGALMIAIAFSLQFISMLI
tara:strand:+ start:2030 stop:2269 length:240 start_codon:yes stop_codon:yes gene_type:complete